VAPLAGVGKALEPIVGLPAPGRKVVDSEVKFIERMDHMSSLLTNPNMTSVRLVANPDFFSIQNMKRTLLTSNLHNTNVDMVIINKILPASIKDKYLFKWKQIQENSLKYAETNFYPLPIKKLKLYDQELKGLEMLEVCGKDLYRDSDPAEIFYKGNLFNVETSKEKCEISVLVPYTEKDQFKVERIGEDVVLRVTTEIGDNLVLIPLPTVTLGMRLTKAKLLEYLKEKYNINAFIFDDDTFIIDKGWVSEICSLMISRKLDLIWGCNARANLVTEELFRKMKEAGLRCVFIGVESGSQRVLDEVYNKGITLEQVESSATILKKLKLNVMGYFMLGAPTETKEEMNQTIRFASKLPIDEATFSITTPLPKTYLYDKTKDLIKKDVEEFDYYKTSVYGKDLSFMKRKALLSFYLSPKRIFSTIKLFITPSLFRKSMTKLKRF